MAHLKEGDPAPHFTGKDQSGNAISLTNLKAYGAWGKKSMYGKEYEGILRKTFVIDEKGIIIKIFDKVDTKNHSEQILEDLK